MPYFLKWAHSFCLDGKRPDYIIEPFCGGGSVSLAALFYEYVDKALISEIDKGMFNFWLSVANGYSGWLANKVIDFEPTPESVGSLLSTKATTSVDKAFQILVKNRTHFGGILTNESRMMLHGSNGEGVLSRWYPITLSNRLIDIGRIADRINISLMDGIEFIQKYSRLEGAIFFIDPPYTAGAKNPGRRLYNHWRINHERLFEACADVHGQFLMTYADTEQVRWLAKLYRFELTEVPMRTSRGIGVNELVISKNKIEHLLLA